MAQRQLCLYLFAQASRPPYSTRSRSFSCNSNVFLVATDLVKQAGSRPYQRIQQSAHTIERIAQTRPSTDSSITAQKSIHTPKGHPNGLRNGIDLRAQGASRHAGPLRIIRAPQNLLGGTKATQGRASNSLRPAGKDPSTRGRYSERSYDGRPRQDLGSRTARRQTPRRRRFEDGTDAMAQEETLGERLYAKAKKDTEAKEAVKAFIAKVDFQTLVGGGPSTVTGNWGLSEVVEEEIDRLSADGLTDPAIRIEQLTRKMRRGEFVRFKDRQERSSILGVAPEMAEYEQKTMGKLGLDFEQVSEEGRAQLLAGLLKGGYVMPKSKGKETLLESLSRYTTKNGSYLREQGDSLAERVKRLLPVRAGKDGGATKRVLV